MKRKKGWFCLGMCVLGVTVYGQEAISEFAKRTLNFDLKPYLFGMSLQSSPGFGKPDGLFGPSINTIADVSWYTNAVSVAYKERFPDRNVSFGFKNYRLAAIRIMVNALHTDFIDLSGSGAELEKKLREAAEKRKPKQIEIDRIRDEFQRLGGKDKLRFEGQSVKFQDGRFRIEYHSYCTPTENLFGAIVITPLEKTP